MPLRNQSSSLESFDSNFNPSKRSGLSAWFDASDLTTIVSSSNKVSSWKDKSGNNNHLTQSVDLNKPSSGIRSINGKNAIGFDGSNGYLNVPSGLYGISNASNTVIAVCRPAQIKNCNIIAGNDGGTGRFRLLSGDAIVTYIAGSNSTAGFIAGSPIDAPVVNETATLVGIFQGNSYCCIKGGLASFAVAGNNFTMTSATVGMYPSGIQIFYGDMAEILIFNRALSNSELNEIGTYLQFKWGSAWTNIKSVPFKMQARGTIVGFGDSITFGSMATTSSKQWINIIGTSMRSVVTNKGSSGTVLQNSNDASGFPRSGNGRDRYIDDLTGSNKKDVAIILYGYNDMRYTGGGDMSLANYINDYQEIITGLISGGYASSDIVLCSLPWSTNALYSSGSTGFTGSNREIHEQYNSAIRALAVSNVTLFADVYSAMRDNGGAGLIYSDNIHPNDSGHAVIAQSILNATFVV